jgi:hypothetical protein
MAGRKPIEIDLAEVERLAGLGLTEQQICDCIGISHETLRIRKRDSLQFLQALKRGKSKTLSQVSNWLHELCAEKNLGALIWFEKTRAGFSERVTLEGNQNKPIVLAAAGTGGGSNPIAAFAPRSVGDRNLLGEGEDDSSGSPLGEDGAGCGEGFC